MEDPALFETLPFEDVVQIIEEMDYRTIIRFCQTSTEFREYCSNPIIKPIIERKRTENLAGSVTYYADEDMATVAIFLRDTLSNQTFQVSWSLTFSLDELEDILNTFDFDSSDEEFSVNFDEGHLYYQPDSPHTLLYYANVFTIGVNKILFVRLLEEYEKLSRDGTGGEVYVRTDGSVDKVLW